MSNSSLRIIEAYEDRVKLERNARVKARYDELMADGKHGHYETMFKIVHEEVERANRRVGGTEIGG